MGWHNTTIWDIRSARIQWNIQVEALERDMDEPLSAVIQLCLSILLPSFKKIGERSFCHSRGGNTVLSPPQPQH